MNNKELTFAESDGLVKNELIFTKSDAGLLTEEPAYVNTVLNKGSKLKKSFTYLFREIFLPDGFPDSVHSDYIAYQIWNAVQVFASTVTGALTTHAVLKGVGVGDTEATSLSAAITWILKDGTGSISRIVFVWAQGGNLDAQSKKWRLFADVLNDIAMGIELLVPLMSKYSLEILCVTNAMKAIVGVAGCTTRMALKQHQALRKNLADVAAKEGSQETLINLLGLLAGVVILLFLTENYFVHLYILLVFIHLYANFYAVRSLEMNSLNEDRLCLIIRDYLLFHTISNVKDINKRESLFSWRKPAKRIFGFDIEIGSSLERVMKLKLIEVSDVNFLQILFNRRKYLSVMDIKRRKVHLLLAKDCIDEDIIAGYFHSCIQALIICQQLEIQPVCSPPSYPLMKIILFSDNHSIEFNNKSKLTAKIATAMDEVVYGEYLQFEKLLRESAWMNKADLLPVKLWRGSWI